MLHPILSRFILPACFASWAVLATPQNIEWPRDAPSKSLVRMLDTRSEESASPIPPTEDPFYTEPEPFYEQLAPGTVITIRAAPGNLTTLVTNCTAAYNILYRTTDSRYAPSWAVTTVFVPTSPVPALLSYQIPYDSASLDASPSFSLYGPDSGTNSIADISTALSSGWIVNVPDYEGPLASFTAGVQSGHATIDSIRAVLSANDQLNLTGTANGNDSVSYAMWGYSGGALASEWAAELAVQYAPELNFSGAALGGLTPNVTSVLLSINGSIAAGLAPSSILGVTSQYPDVRDLLVSRLKTEGPYNATGFLAALNYTLDEATVAYAFQNLGDYFVGGFADLLGPGPTSVQNQEGQMGYHGVPQMPLYVYKAIDDEISPVNDTDALVARFCGVGANILYQKNPIGGHSAEFVNGRAGALTWLESVLGGRYAQDYNTTGCETQIVAVNITDSPFKRRDGEVGGWWLGNSDLLDSVLSGTGTS